MVSMTSNAGGETSGSASNAEDNNMVGVVIYGKRVNLPKDAANLDVVRVCHVPKWLSSVKPEVFTPQFVGLGPYHHFRAELIMSEELKLSAANRVPNVKHLLPQKDPNNNFVFDNDIIEAFYHADVHTACDHRTLLYVLAVDGLFLLALLHGDPRSNLSHFLTGKQGMLLVNAAGVEVRLDGIFRDVFMLENQIPIHVLKKIRGVNSKEIQQEEHNLGETMLNFCRYLCPLVYSEQVSPREAEEDRAHLLDLMYHLIVPQHVPQKPKPKPKLNFFSYILFYLFCLFSTTLLFLYWFAYIGHVIIRWVVRPLFSKAIPWAVGPILGTSNPRKMPSFRYFLSQVREAEYLLLKLNLLRRDPTDSSEEVVTIPSATKLRKVLKILKFKPAVGGISSIKFKLRPFQTIFYLPPIRLHAISEVIIRNLVAYESLTKSHGDLIFTRYIDLMSALILNSEDVKLLKQEKIIYTYLSDEAVVQLFNGKMSTSIGPTKMAKLEKVINKVNYEFYPIQTLCWIIVECLRFCLILVLPALINVFIRVLCLTVFGSTEVSNFVRVGDL